MHGYRPFMRALVNALEISSFTPHELRTHGGRYWPQYKRRREKEPSSSFSLHFRKTVVFLSYKRVSLIGCLKALNFLTSKAKEKVLKSGDFRTFYGGQYRTRTCDPMHVKHVLIPAELTVHRGDYYIKSPGICQELFYFSAVCARTASGVTGRRRQQCRK